MKPLVSLRCKLYTLLPPQTECILSISVEALDYSSSKMIFRHIWLQWKEGRTVLLNLTIAGKIDRRFYYGLDFVNYLDQLVDQTTQQGWWQDARKNW